MGGYQLEASLFQRLLSRPFAFAFLTLPISVFTVPFSKTLLADIIFQFSSVAQSCPTLCDPMNRSMPGLPVPSPVPGVHPNPCPLRRWCHPTISSSVVPFSSCPQSFPASGAYPMSQFFIRWSKYWSLSLKISPASEHPELIFFRMDWLDLLAVQGTLKSLL